MTEGADTVFIGVRGTVLAIDRASGVTRWSTSLKGTDFVNVALHDGDLFASSKGRLYRLDPATGAIEWCNELPGLGWGLVSIAGASQATAAVEKKRRDTQRAAATAAAAS